MKPHLKDKQEELVWALALQGYSNEEIRSIFNMPNRTYVFRIVARMPKGWIPKWIKREDYDAVE